MVFSAPLTIRRMSTSNPHRMAKGSRCIFLVINRPKSSSESVGIRVAPPPRSDGRFIRRLIERVLGIDRSWATSSTSVALFFGNCSISEDSVFPAVWLLLRRDSKGLLRLFLVRNIIFDLIPYLFCVSVSECSESVSIALMAE